MSLEFLSLRDDEPGAPPARSPMERRARAAGGRCEVRDGFSVIVDYGAPAQEAHACTSTAAWVDVSGLGKLEVQASAADLNAIAAEAGDGVTLELGRATRANGAWWCPLTRTRMLVLCERAALAGLRARVQEAAAAAAQPASVIDVSTVFAALTLAGPGAREVFARFCAIDLRPHVTPVAGLRPGSVARQPGLIVREAEHRYLVLFGWAVADYIWTVVEDAARHLGGRPAGVDALGALGEPVAEAAGA